MPSLCSQATVYVEVAESIIAKDDNITINEDTPVSIDVLVNDSFGPKGPNSGAITIVTPAANGTATVDDNGTPNDPTDDVINYTPNPNFYGEDSLEYQICDAENNCETAIVFITVNPINNPPVANEDHVTIPVGGTIALEVLDNDNDDLDGALGGLDNNSLKITTTPKNGVAVVNNMNGTIAYAANNGFIGEDTLIYEICDIGTPTLCDTAMMIIKVGVPDLIPIISIDPSIIYGVSDINIIVDIFEEDFVSTDGSEILVAIPKDGDLAFSFDPNVTQLGFYTVNNTAWTYSSSNPNFHIFTTNSIIPAGGVLSFGVSSSFDPSGIDGQKPITVMIFAGGGEIKISNNINSDTLEFFAE